MSNHKLTAENMLAQLPAVLQNDPSMLALATSIAEKLNHRIEEIQSVAIYTRIDELPEDLLDILAHDFKIDWWDTEYSLEEKRKVLKNSWHVHRTLGTKAAVETAVSAIFPGARVTEWFEYGGKPYHFRLLLDATFENVTPEKHQRVLERIEFYKNLRSVFDGVEYFHISGTATQYFNAALVSEDMEDSATALRY